MRENYILLIGLCLLIFGSYILYYTIFKKDRYNHSEEISYDFVLMDKIRGVSFIIFGIIALLAYFFG